MIFMQNFYLRGFLYKYSILFIFVQFLKFFGVSVFVTYVPWYVFLFKYHTNSFQNIGTDFKSGFFLSRLHNMVRIRDIQAQLGWLDSLWFNTILSKERKKTVYTLKAFYRILQFSCTLPTFFSWVNPQTEVVKRAKCCHWNHEAVRNFYCL